MEDPQRVLLLGATGRTGRCVLEKLLGRGIVVRVIVRDSSGLPLDHPNIQICEGDLLALTDQALLDQVRGCQAILSCLGHPISLKGVFGPPRDLVEQAIRRICSQVNSLAPAQPIKVVLMTSVSVNHPTIHETRRSGFERAVLLLLRCFVPPARDNQRAADFLAQEVGQDDPFVEWVVIRPDTLLDGEESEISIHETLENSLFSPGHTRRSNVARFMTDLVIDQEVWDRWRWQLPVVVDHLP